MACPIAIPHIPAFVARPRLTLLREVVREACYGLYHHRFRAALSMLGISWGIVSVVVLLAYGDGFRGALDAGFRGAFSDGTVVVWPGQTSMLAGGERAGAQRQCRARGGDSRTDPVRCPDPVPPSSGARGRVPLCVS